MLLASMSVINNSEIWNLLETVSQHVRASKTVNAIPQLALEAQITDYGC